MAKFGLYTKNTSESTGHVHTIEIGYKNYNTLRNDPNYPDAYAYLNGYKSSETNNLIPESLNLISLFFNA